MTNPLKIHYVLLSVLITSCGISSQQLSKSDREVMKEILPVIIDSMYVEVRYHMAPPPVVSIDSSSSEPKFILRKKDLAFKEEIRQNFILRKEEPRVIVMVVDDFIRSFDENELDNIPFESFQGRDSLKFGYVMDLRSVSTRSGMKIIPSSYYIPCSEPHPRYSVLSEFEFSRIAINKEFNHGMLTCKYECGLGCGLGYRIFIRKDDEQWKIDRIIFEYSE